jgi:VCBS repeat-containing protein
MTKPRNTWLPLLALLALLAVASVSCGPGGDPTQPGEGDVEVRIVVEGPGRVIRGPQSSECFDDCVWTVDGDTPATFDAVPASGYVFVGWEGPCEAFENPCRRTFEGGDTIKATFALHALRLDLTGDGEGTFSIQGAGINEACTDDCGVPLDAAGRQLAIYAFRDSDRTLVEEAWTGPCLPGSSRTYCLVEINGLTTIGKTWRHPPVAADDVYPAFRNTPLVVAPAAGVLANDDDTDGDVLTASLVSGPQNGDLTLAADGGFTYTPDADYVGSDGFSYRVRDAFGNEDTADVAITVTNRAPIAIDDAYGTGSGMQLVVDAAQGILANDDDPDGDTLTATLVNGVNDGTLVFATDGGFSYTPRPGFAGTDSFTYRANDGREDSSLATVTITVGNEAPTAVDDTFGTTGTRILIVVADDGVLANDDDPDGDTLAAALVDDVAFSDLDLAADGSFSYTPTSGNSGIDTFTYTAFDGIATSNTATVTITVTNAAPIATNDSYGTTRNAALTVAAPGVVGDDSDPDGDTLTAALVDDVTHGDLVLSPNGGFTYSPDTGYVGTDTFTYTASDGVATSNAATVTINVSANGAPTAVNDAYVTDQNTPLALDDTLGVLFNDSDPNGDTLTAILVTNVANGTLTLNDDGSFGYDPASDYTGPDGFTYRANDGITNSNTAAVTINVLPVD